MLSSPNDYKFVQTQNKYTRGRIVPALDGTESVRLPQLENLRYAMEMASVRANLLGTGGGGLPASVSGRYSSSLHHLDKRVLVDLMTFCRDRGKFNVQSPGSGCVLLSPEWHEPTNLPPLGHGGQHYITTFSGCDLERHCDPSLVSDLPETDSWRYVFYDLGRMNRMLFPVYGVEGMKFAEIHNEEMMRSASGFRGPVVIGDGNTTRHHWMKLDPEDDPTTYEETFTGYVSSRAEIGYDRDGRKTSSVEEDVNLGFLFDYETVRANFRPFPLFANTNRITVWYSLLVNYTVYTDRGREGPGDQNTLWGEYATPASTPQTLMMPMESGVRFFTHSFNTLSVLSDFVIPLVNGDPSRPTGSLASVRVDFLAVLASAGRLGFIDSLPNSWTWSPPS